MSTALNIKLSLTVATVFVFDFDVVQFVYLISNIVQNSIKFCWTILQDLIHPSLCIGVDWNGLQGCLRSCFFGLDFSLASPCLLR